MKPLRVSVALGAAMALSSCGFAGSVPNGAVSSSQANWTPQYLVMPLVGVSSGELEAARAAGKTVRFYEGSVKSPLDEATYGYKIVGEDPRKSNGTTDIPYVPIVIVITYPDRTVLDPTKPGCGDSVSVEQRFLKGPNFQPTRLFSNGVDLGKAQLGDAEQRAEFWKVLKGHQYHTVLQAGRDPVVVHVKAPSGSQTGRGACSGSGHRIGTIEITPFFQLVEKLAEKYASPAQIPILLTYNTFEVSPSGCCILGFHGAFKRSSGVQTYAVADYKDHGTNCCPEVADISVATHEIGELLNDPFIRNGAPAWGFVGQYLLGCSTLFEVGDPLTGTQFELKHNGWMYHPQELAFFSWFFRTPAIGTGGKYSFKGTFSSTEPRCV